MGKISSYASLVKLVVFIYVCLIPTAQPLAQQALYDVKTVKTISGTIKGIRPIRTTGHTPVIIIVETAKKEKYTVNLGPVWYFKKQVFDIKEGDEVEVTGSDVSVANRNMLLAFKVVKGDSVLELRDSNGTPYWAD